ncbi:hypothetical protein PGTUg99_028504 [Puccinia graminis f. sp. tritici]|uniref:Uncharacterized protein n=1 Tax=Puccinia graminis f. sp. tritici TaxID=56615 RepID=A0A5B0RVC4_PUCGR|nr:hypothetical protein PGTUg99_028504 [Puccinia graminis f. sp. tritici]
MKPNKAAMSPMTARCGRRAEDHPTGLTLSSNPHQPLHLDCHRHRKSQFLIAGSSIIIVV